MFKDVYWLRDVASKAKRRVKKLIGRPDPTPWVLRPNSAAGREAYVDFVFVPSSVGNAAMSNLLHEAFSPLGVSLLIATPQAAAALAKEVRSGKIKPHVLLNLFRGQQFAEVVEAAEKAGICIINDPLKRQQWCEDGASEKFEQAGLSVQMVGDSEGQQARRLRAFNIFGAKTFLWWRSETRQYEALTWDEVRKQNLIQAERLLERVAQLTELDFFCCEMAIINENGHDRFVLVDGCNDQIDLTPGSAGSEGIPDEWVKWICHCIAEFVWRKKNGVAATVGHSMWLGGKAENSVSLAGAKKRMGTAA